MTSKDLSCKYHAELEGADHTQFTIGSTKNVIPTFLQYLSLLYLPIGAKSDFYRTHERNASLAHFLPS